MPRHSSPPAPPPRKRPRYADKRHADPLAAIERERERRRQARLTSEHRMPGPKKGTPRPFRPQPWDPGKDKRYTFTVPVALDLESIPEDFRWPAAWFLSDIKRIYFSWRADPAGFSHKKQRYACKVVPPRVWRPMRWWLVKNGIIEEDHDVRPGEKCRGYRLTPDYRRGKVVQCPDPAVNAALHRLHQRQQEDLQPVHVWLQEHLRRCEFDYRSARPIIESLRPQHRRTRRHPLRPTTTQHRIERDEYCRLLAGEEWSLTPDEYGRLSSPITRLERELRCCLNISGCPITWIDLRNSQPLLLGILVRDWLTGSRMARQRLLNRKFTVQNCYQAMDKFISARHPATPPHYPQHTTPHTTPTPSNQRLLSVDGARMLRRGSPVTLPPDLVKYLRRCERGEFYEKLMSRRERERRPGYRAKFKDRVFRLFFGKAKQTGKFVNRLRERFKGKYPTVWGVLAALKKRNYRHSSHVLQNFEATIFVHRICRRLMSENPAVPVLTIHDSIGTTAAHVGRVEEAIRHEFEKLGVKPTLSTER
jgi:hypothetical protein